MILTVLGCSHSANSGFEKNINKHYVNLLKNQLNCEINNISIGGMSNHEVFQRAIEQAQNFNNDDVFLVQWSSLGRQWVYCHENNVDNFTQVLPRVCGFGKHEPADQLQKLYLGYFFNQYMHLKHWLGYMVALQEVLKHNNVQYFYVNGFDNYLGSLDVYRHRQLSSLSNITINQELRSILDFDNRPDDYILTKLNALLKLYNRIDFDHCVKFGDFHFGQAQLDVADDNTHWGEQCNKIWAKEIFNHLKNKNWI